MTWCTTFLSAVALLGLDPWRAAAALSELPRDCATQRLVVLILRLPGGRWAQAEAGGRERRLIKLLPSRSRPGVPLIEKADGLPGMAGFLVAKMLICAARRPLVQQAATRCRAPITHGSGRLRRHLILRIGTFRSWPVI
jgi:hypothetical protein